MRRLPALPLLRRLTRHAARTDAQRFYQRLGFTPSHIGFKKTL